MELAICHYSFHRSYKAGNWDLFRLCDEVKSLGVNAIDFHAGLLGDPHDVVEKARRALAASGLVLSGFSLSTNFNNEDDGKQQQMLENTRTWMKVAAELGAPVSRIFGGSLRSPDPEAKSQATARVIAALRQISAYAEELRLILAVENHGGLPCSGQEQVSMLDAVGSPYLKATVDIGNYLQCGQESYAGTEIAAGHAAYVHVKDMKKVPDASKPWGWTIKACTIGEGDVAHRRCLDILARAGYDGFVALEYEGTDDEAIGVPASIRFLKSIM